MLFKFKFYRYLEILLFSIAKNQHRTIGFYRKKQHGILCIRFGIMRPRTNI